ELALEAEDRPAGPLRRGTPTGAAPEGAMPENPGADPVPGRLAGRITATLGSDELTADEVAIRLDASIDRVLVALGRLELEGWVRRGAGGRFAAVDRSTAARR
ncbi:MAG: hypothetical protein MJB57_18725, partial [Gemmatimonadetes bacterium]|nr:hypothetical protein [Gemmatimonadota bacterium]